LGWEPRVSFSQGLEATVAWYRDNEAWWRGIKSGEYMNFFERYYAERLKQAG
jgi:dTDP-glucose 4,6-dehydratase